MYIFLPDLRTRHFSKDNLDPLLENGIIRNKFLYTGCTHCYWDVVASRVSQLIEQENMCVYTNPHIPMNQ